MNQTGLLNTITGESSLTYVQEYIEKVLDFAPTTRAVIHKQLAVVAFFGGGLGDEMLRQIIIKIG